MFFFVFFLNILKLKVKTMAQDPQDNIFYHNFKIYFILLYCMNGKIQYPVSLRLYIIPLQDFFYMFSLYVCGIKKYLFNRIKKLVEIFALCMNSLYIEFVYELFWWIMFVSIKLCLSVSNFFSHGSDLIFCFLLSLWCSL